MISNMTHKKGRAPMSDDTMIERSRTGVAAIEGSNFDDPSDILWGAAAIGQTINKTPKAVYDLVAKRKLDGAVRKFAGGELVGSRRALQRLIFGG
jgi:hypothetical protein